MKKLWLAALLAVGIAAPASASIEIATKAGCTACHAVDKKIVGPAFKDIAAKYKGQGDAVAKLSEKVRKGGSGVFGPIPMPPNSAEKINDADLKAVIDWVLKS
jgi:cytochrome c